MSLNVCVKMSLSNKDLVLSTIFNMITDWLKIGRGPQI